VLATTVGSEVCTDAVMLRASHAQPGTVAPGLRWLKHPAASTPVWLETPERLAARAMHTVVEWFV
jgi:hypothetical protein